MRPGRSVKSIVPSGVKPMSQTWSRPVTTGVTVKRGVARQPCMWNGNADYLHHHSDRLKRKFS